MFGMDEIVNVECGGKLRESAPPPPPPPPAGAAAPLALFAPYGV